MEAVIEIAYPERIFGLCVVLLWVSALYCIMVSRNLIRIIIGVGVLGKGLTLLLAAAGHFTARTGTSQALIITYIVVEVVLIAVAAGIVLGIFNRTGSLSASELQRLKG